VIVTRALEDIRAEFNRVWEANAELRAAAEELLAALEHDRWLNVPITKLKAAIAKAEESAA
jgi:hypothetical protein